MRGYKFLVMQTNKNGEHSMFLNAGLGRGGRCCSVTDNVTHFRPLDREGCHDNDNYWNSAEELLVGFSRWYNRMDEKTSYNMGNRLYSATYTYRFFRVDEDMYSYKCPFEEANNNLTSFEITEEEFIRNIIGSWAFEQVSFMFSEWEGCFEREAPLPVEVQIVYNEDFNTWCWISDYQTKNKEGLVVETVKVPVGFDYNSGKNFISGFRACPYRFGGNDAYNKRKLLVD